MNSEYQVVRLFERREPGFSIGKKPAERRWPSPRRKRVVSVWPNLSAARIELDRLEVEQKDSSQEIQYYIQFPVNGYGLNNH